MSDQPHIYFKTIGDPDAPLRFVWMHGWGHHHRFMEPMAKYWNKEAHNILLDLPGFGQSPPPKQPWDVADYATAVEQLLSGMKNEKPTVLIGHSFGCRVALHMAVRETNRYKSLVLIAPAGLKMKRTYLSRLKSTIIKWFYRSIKGLDRLTGWDFKKKWANRLGSADYRAAQGVMRDILVKTVNENLSETASKVKIPVLLMTGSNDPHTPPDFVHRYARLIPDSDPHILQGEEHNSILLKGRHQVNHLIERFLRQRNIL